MAACRRARAAPARSAGPKQGRVPPVLSCADDRRRLVDAVREILSGVEAEERVRGRIAQDSEGIAPFLHRLDRIADDLPQHDDALVGAAEIFAAPVGDGALAFLRDAILLV